MTEQNTELELYKLVTKRCEECGWINDDQFYVWIQYCELSDFMKKIVDIFGNFMFDDGGLEGHLMKDYVCIPLSDALEGREVDFESVFPKDEFNHR